MGTYNLRTGVGVKVGERIKEKLNIERLATAARALDVGIVEDEAFLEFA